jgi:hypothetical protein
MAALTEATDNVVDAPAPPLDTKKRASDAAPSPAAKRPSLGPSSGPLLKFTPEDQALLVELCKKPFERQAKHFINAFWDRATANNKPFGENQEECERIYTWSQEFSSFDKGKRGNELDEFEAHQFLEKCVGALTVHDMRSALKAIDIDFNRMMSLTEFLIFHYSLQEKDWVYLVNWAPGMSVAQRRLIEAAQAQMASAREKLAVSREMLEKSQDAAQQAQKEQELASNEASLSEAAAAESTKATQDLEAQEQAKKDELAKQEAMACDESLSVVKRSRAKAQVAILKNDNGQSLRTMRITQGAAARKMAKAAIKAREAASKAEASKLEAEQAAKVAEDAVAAADAAVQSTTQQLEEAKAACAEGGCEEGTFWWLDREFEESMKRVPASVAFARRRVDWSPTQVHGPEAEGQGPRGADGVAAQVGDVLAAAAVSSCVARHTAGAPLPLSY